MIRVKITERSSEIENETLLEIDDATAAERTRILDAVLRQLEPIIENRVELQIDGQKLADVIQSVRPGSAAGEPAGSEPKEPRIKPEHAAILEMNVRRSTATIAAMELTEDELEAIKEHEAANKNRKGVLELLDRLLQEKDQARDPDPYADILAGSETETTARITTDLTSDDLDELYRREEAGQNRPAVRHHIGKILADRHAGSSGKEFDESSARSIGSPPLHQFKPNPLDQSERPGIGTIGELLEGKQERQRSDLPEHVLTGIKIVDGEKRFRCRLLCPCGYKPHNRYIKPDKKILRCHSCGDHLRIKPATELGIDGRDEFGAFFIADLKVQTCQECGREAHYGPCEPRSQE